MPTLTEQSPRTKTAAPGGEARPLRVCFVCTGNTCRSPMAAAVANALAAEYKNNFPEAVRECLPLPVEAISAGLAACEGEPIAANAVLALEAANIPPVPAHDYHTHTAHMLSPELAAQCDLIVGLSGSHVMGLLMQYPQFAGKITGMPKEISDPWGQGLPVYQACLAEITEGVKALLFSAKDES